MKAINVISGMNPDMSATFIVSNNDYKLACKLIQKGWNDWWGKDAEKLGYWNYGYAEVCEEYLNENNIEYYLIPNDRDFTPDYVGYVGD